MDRKVGEIFDFDGHQIEVVEVKDYDCTGCFWEDKNCRKEVVNDIAGDCVDIHRDDSTNVIFKEVNND